MDTMACFVYRILFLGSIVYFTASANLMLQYNWPEPIQNIDHFPHESSCHYYYLMLSNEDITIEKCPDGQLFDYVQHKCISDKEHVHCWSRHFGKIKHDPMHIKHKKHFKCPYPWGKYPHLHDCSKYHLCLNGKSRVKKCAQYEMFDKISRKCIASIDAVCADKSDVVEHGYMCPKTWGSFTYLKDCSKYYECLQRKPSLRTCQRGNLFDDRLGKCAPSEHVYCGLRHNPYEKVSSAAPETPQEASSTTKEVTPNPPEASSTIKEVTQNPQEASSTIKEVTPNPQEASSIMKEVTSNPQGASSTIKEVTSNSQEASSTVKEITSNPLGASSTIKEVTSNPLGASSTIKEVTSNPQGASSTVKDDSSNPQEASSTIKELTPNPQEASSTIKEVTSNPQEASSTIREVTPNPQEASSTIKEVTSNPQEESSTIKEVTSNPQESTTKDVTLTPALSQSGNNKPKEDKIVATGETAVSQSEKQQETVNLSENISTKKEFSHASAKMASQEESEELKKDVSTEERDTNDVSTSDKIPADNKYSSSTTGCLAEDSMCTVERDGTVVKCSDSKGLQPHPKDETRFVDCTEDKIMIYSCPQGLTFHPETKRCKWQFIMGSK